MLRANVIWSGGAERLRGDLKVESKQGVEQTKSKIFYFNSKF